MKKLFLQITKKTKNIVFLVIVSVFIFIALRLVPVYEILHNFYQLDGISFTRKIEVFYEYIFIPFFEAGWYEKLSSLVLAVLTTFNILLFVIFAKRQKRLLSGRGFFASISGIFLGLFGVGCISCGAFILAPLITFIGLGAYTNYFIEHAGVISAIGIILVIGSIIYLLKQITKPMICK